MTLDCKRIIHFFFPPSEDEQLLQTLDTRTFITISVPTYVHNAITLLPYTDRTVKAAIHLNKYHHHHKAQLLLGCVLQHYLQTTVQHGTYIVPIPLSRKRLRARGYNQTEEIVKRAIKHTPHLQSAPGLLHRTRDTKAQTTLSRQERLRNMHNAFSVPERKKHLIPGAHIILVDDVLTTGATIKAAKDALQTHTPACVTCVTLAH